MDGDGSDFSGFASSNSGTIQQSFHSGRIVKTTNGFGMGGSQINCYYFTNHEDASRAVKLPDYELWVENTKISDDEKAQSFGFSPQVWRYTGDKQVLAFKEESWYTTPDPLPPLPAGGPSGGAEREKIQISSRSDLENFASRVNNGNAEARNALVTLTADINLGGISWTPIGIDKARSFRGYFDGQGHRISNFHIKEKNLEYRGFFGVLEGGVYNLTVDCEIVGDGVIGSMAGLLLGGTIRCCGAVVTLRPKGKSELVGGLVGISTGVIELSYTAGRAKFTPLIPWALFIPPVAVALTLTILLNLPKPPVNKPVETENEALPIPEADLPDLPSPAPNNTENHSISFNTYTEFTASLSTGKVGIRYQSTNADADQKVVLKLKLSNGVVIAETGAIQPGYEITEMTLTDQAKNELTPGRYSGTLLIIPYSIVDESKGFTETALDIKLTVVE